MHGEARYLSPLVPWLWISAGAHASSDDAIKLKKGFQTIEHAARHLAAAHNGACGVFTSYAPQVEWYSRCETVAINRHNVVLDPDLFHDGPRFLFIVEDGKRQPEGGLFDEYLERTTLEPSSSIQSIQQDD